MRISAPLCAALIGLGLAAPSRAAGDAEFAGVWSDNVGGNAKLGPLLIKPNLIKVRGNSYSVEPGSSFADGSLFKVVRTAEPHDKLGCGPMGRVGFIVVQRLPALPGTDRKSIQVLFYGGSTAPDAARLQDDPLVCSIHPFGRGG